jgi:hypothetical protein
MGQIHFEKNITKTSDPILGIMTLFMEAHKCVPIVM